MELFKQLQFFFVFGGYETLGIKIKCVQFKKNFNIFDFPHSLHALILTPMLLMVYCKLARGVLSLTDSHRLTHKRRVTSHSVRGVKFIYFFSLQQQGKTSLCCHVQ